MVKERYQIYELYNFADGNDDILGDMPPQDGMDTRHAMWGLMPYSVDDGTGVINISEDFINFVSNRETYPSRPIPSMPIMVEKFQGCVKNIKEAINRAGDKKKFYNNLLALQEYLIRQKFFYGDPLSKEIVEINETRTPNVEALSLTEEYAIAVAEALAVKVGLPKPEIIKGGSFGVAFRIGEDKVLKITTDVCEADAGAIIHRAKPKTLAYVFEVYKVIDTEQDKAVYALVEVYIPDRPKDEFWRLINIIDDLGNPENREDFTSMMIMLKKKKISIDEIQEFSKFILTTNPESNVSDDDRQKAYQFMSGLFDIARELQQLGIRSLDYSNVDNLGYLNGVLTYYDVGGCRVPEPPFNQNNIIFLPEGQEDLTEEYDRRTADKIAQQVAIKKGLGQPVYMKGGKNGIAYDIGNDRVLKITKDKSEAVENLSLIGEKLKYVAEIYKVFEVSSKSHEIPQTYVIVLEKLETSQEIEKQFDRLEYAFKKIMGVEIPDVIEYYLGEWDDGRVNKDKINSYLKRNPRDAEFFGGLLRIMEETKAYGIESIDFLNPQNLGYKKNGALAFFDVGSGTDYVEPQGAEMVMVDEDGSAKFSTPDAIGQDGFPPYDNTADTSPSIQNNLDANSSMYNEGLTEGVYNKPVYHITNARNVESIKQNGFRPSDEGYIHFAPEPGKGTKNSGNIIITAKIDVHNPIPIEEFHKLNDHLFDKYFPDDSREKNPDWTNSQEWEELKKERGEYLRNKGYDSLFSSNDIWVLNPKAISIIDVQPWNGLREDLDESKLRPVGGSRNSNAYFMSVEDDVFIHFVPKKIAVQIAKTKQLDPSFSETFEDAVFGISITYGTFLPSVQIHNIGGQRSQDYNDYVAIVFKTNDKPVVGHIEEVVWHGVVNIKIIKYLTIKGAENILKHTQYKIGEQDYVLYREEDLEKINEDLEYNHVVGDATEDEFMLTEVIKGGEYQAYHGSKTKIDKFSDEFVGKEEATDQEGPGIYFTTSLDDASRYGNYLYSVILRPRKLVDESSHRRVNTNEIIQLIRSAPDWEDTAQNWAENPKTGLYTAVDSFMKYAENEKDLFQQVWYDFFRHNPIEYVRGMVKLGYDGQIINKAEGNKHFIIYNPDIIEVTNVEDISGEISEERKLSAMKGSSTVSVKKKCRLGGLGNTSVACNQGDINNLDIKPLNEIDYGNAQTYDFQKVGAVQSDEESQTIRYKFSSENNEYNVDLVIAENIRNPEVYDIYPTFSVVGQSPDKLTNENVAFKVLLTVVKIIKTEVDASDLPIKYIGVVISEELGNDTRRLNIYADMVKHYFPNAKIDRRDNYSFIVELPIDLNEEIDASEAHYDEDALQTVIDGKRGVALIGFGSTPIMRTMIDGEYHKQRAISAGLNLIPIKQSEKSHEGLDMNIVYRNGFEKQAKRLYEIMMSHGGYVADKTPEEAREIGKIFDYTDDSIEGYVRKKYLHTLVPVESSPDDYQDFAEGVENDTQIRFTDDQILNQFLNLLNKKSQLSRNPFMPREFVYGDKGSLEFSRFNKQDRNEIELQDIMAFEKQKGIGSSMMQDIIDVADEMGVKLTLTAKPFGNDPKSLELMNLINFYRKFGFVTDLSTFDGEFKSDEEYEDYLREYPDEGMEMYREPRTKESMLTEAEIMLLQDLPFKEEVEQLGGKIFSVGGAVRDEFLGKESKDLDVLVTGIPMDELEKLLSKYGGVNAVGKSFGVLKFVPKGSKEEIDIAIPRTEVATGAGGHQGFDITSDHELPIEKDLERRDFTINAIAKDIDGNIIDPYNGQDDLKNKIIRIVNPEAFSDDPLRMLRAVQFASRFGFTIEPTTMQMIKKNAATIKEIAPERILIELDKIITKGNPLIGVQLLSETGLFKQIFGNQIKPSQIGRRDFTGVRTMAELLFLMMNGVVQNPAEFYLSRFSTEDAKRDRVYKELQALDLAFNSPLFDQQMTSLQARSIAHNMFTTAPQTLESQVLPEVIENAAKELLQGKYPKTVNELAVNGNDLMQKGLQGKAIGEMQKSMLIRIYADKIKNNKEELLSLLKNKGTQVEEGYIEYKDPKPRTWNVNGKDVDVNFFVKEYDKWNNQGGVDSGYRDPSLVSVLEFLQNNYEDFSKDAKLNKELYWKLIDREILNEEPVKNIAYSAVVLTGESHDKLIKVFSRMIPEGWKTYAHHMTLNMGEIDPKYKDDLGQEVELTVVDYAIDELVMAVGVEGYPTNNAKPHITLAVNIDGGGKPFLSNKLTDWKTIGFSIKVTGVVTEVPR